MSSLEEPPVHLVGGGIHQPVVGAVPDDVLRAARPGGRCDRLGQQPRDQDVLDQRGDVAGPHTVATPGQDAGDLARHALGVWRIAKPGAGAAPDAHRRRAADHFSGRGSCGDEVLQATAEGVLAGRDQRGVRDRQPERVTEQRGYREPVGRAPTMAASHAALTKPSQPTVWKREGVAERGERPAGPSPPPSSAAGRGGVAPSDACGALRGGATVVSPSVSGRRRESHGPCGSGTRRRPARSARMRAHNRSRSSPMVGAGRPQAAPRRRPGSRPRGSPRG